MVTRATRAIDRRPRTRVSPQSTGLLNSSLVMANRCVRPVAKADTITRAVRRRSLGRPVVDSTEPSLDPTS